MASSTPSLKAHPQREDLLAHLPVSSTTEYGKGQVIYNRDVSSSSLYLVVTGKVGISQITDDGSEVLLEIVRPDELFGESAFLGVSPCTEEATVIERARLMTWAISDMEDLVMKRPRLAIALLQILAQRTPSSLNGSRAFRSTPSNGGWHARSSTSPGAWGPRRKTGSPG